MGIVDVIAGSDGIGEFAVTGVVEDNIGGA